MLLLLPVAGLLVLLVYVSLRPTTAVTAPAPDVAFQARGHGAMTRHRAQATLSSEVDIDVLVRADELVLRIDGALVESTFRVPLGRAPAPSPQGERPDRRRGLFATSATYRLTSAKERAHQILLGLANDEETIQLEIWLTDADQALAAMGGPRSEDDDTRAKKGAYR